MTTLAWKLARLRVMGLREMAWRAGCMLQARLETRGVGLARQPPAPENRPCGRAWVTPLPQRFAPPHYRTAADRILAGRFTLFALQDAVLGFPPDWNRDPNTRRVAPQGFGKTLDYRDDSRVGDIKYLWELNRHLELVTLAEAFYLTGDLHYAAAVQTLLDSWFAACPYAFGVNWVSALEPAIRLVNWATAWHLLGGEDSPLFATPAGSAFRHRWLDSIYQHCHFIAGHYSRHSSANNHLFGEYAGVFIGSLTWPLWKPSAGWLATARQGLEDEATRQNAADGVNREQATGYHHEVMDMMLLCGLYGRANDAEFSRSYWGRLEKMLEFIASVMDAGGHVPMAGDADDVTVVRFAQPAGSDVYRSSLASGAVLFERGAFKAKAQHFDDKTRWLLGDAAQARFDALSTDDCRLPVHTAFQHGGYYILGDRFETPEEVRIVADAGPLGYLAIAAHGHADALAFTLSAAGHELLIDPGTYAYHSQPRWRSYFRGTSAHNTVRVDAANQSLEGGSFLWLRHAQARCLEVESTAGQDRWIAEHDGYLRLPDPVSHRRELRYDKATRRLTITYHLTCRETHTVDFFWHFAEHCAVTLHGRDAAVENGPVGLRITLPQGFEVSVAHGQDDPPLGWISRRYDEKTACATLWARGKICGTWTGLTVMTIDFHGPRESVA